MLTTPRQMCGLSRSLSTQTYVCIDVYSHVSKENYSDMCADVGAAVGGAVGGDMHVNMYVDMCVDMCEAMCVDMCEAMCVDMCTQETYEAVLGVRQFWVLHSSRRCV